MSPRKQKPKTPHFFKPLLPGFQHHLVIPESFYVKYLEVKRAEKAVLRTPMGKLWHVKLNGRVIFDDGWEEFCEEEELKVGYFLVFGLVKAADVAGLVFDVLVFDHSCCLRDCCFVEEETLQEVSDQSAGHLKNNKKDIDFEEKPGASAPQHPYFVLTLSFYAANSAALNIPRKFGRENGLSNRRCNIVLVNKKGKEWFADLRFKGRDGQVYICGSWSAFCRANSIKAGDSYIFKLIRSGKTPVLKVTRCPEELKPKPETRKQRPKLQAYVTVSKTNIKKYLLRIPAIFAEKSGIKRNLPEEIILRNERGKSWTVTPRKSSNGAVNLGLGWTTFARSNGIKVGDVLKLELIKKGIKPVIKISGEKLGKRSIRNYKKANRNERLKTLEDVKLIIKPEI